MGMGMGGGVATKQKKGGAKKKKTQGGAKFDVSKAVLKSEKLYDELQRKEAKAFDKDDDNMHVVRNSNPLPQSMLSNNNNLVRS